MLSLVINTLLISSYLVSGNNWNSALVAHTDSGGQVLYYEVQNDNNDLYVENDYTFILPQGSLSFSIEDNYSRIGNYYSYDLQFKVLGESVYSNLYLYNLRAYYGDVAHSYNVTLPNVYFMGQNEFYIDNEDGNFTIQWESSSDQPYIYLDYDIGILPTMYFDGSQYQQGYSDGWNAGNDKGFEDGYRNGQRDGYAEGLEVGMETNGEMFTIFNGILNVAAIPINVFLQIFNFEIFGINITSLVSALLSVAILIIVIRLITGKKSE